MKSLPVLQPLCCGPDLRRWTQRRRRPRHALQGARRPTRVAIVNRLASGEACCVCDLTGAFDLSQPTVSHHLRILRDAGLVEAERRGTWAYYRLVPDAIDRLRDVFSTPALVPA